jgi:hypothetical protein
MKKYVMLFMALSLVAIPCVMANGAANPRISPLWPVMVESPYTFDVWAQTGDVYDVKVLLVVTQECYDGMPSTGDAVTVDGSGITKGTFTGVTTNSDNVPPTADAPYEAASLKSHLSYDLAVPLGASDTIYWALSPVVFDLLTATHEDLDVTLDSTAPRMLVYLMGNIEDNSGDLDTRTPTTNPGFMIPEVAIGTIMAVAAMFTALGLYAYKKKHTPKQ